MNDPIIIEELFDAPAQLVWQAITDKEEMKSWYFQLEQFRAEPGFRFSFEGGTENRKYVHHCKILSAIPFKELTYSWEYEDFTGSGRVSFYLPPIDNQTKLKLVHEGIESFSGNNNPDFAKKNFEEGWNYIIRTSLKNYLNGKKLTAEKTF